MKKIVSKILAFISSVVMVTSFIGCNKEEAPVYNINTYPLEQKVSNDTATYNFTQDPYFNPEWKIYKSSSATEDIPTKVVSLNPGNNYFYIVSSEEKTIYVNLYRRQFCHMYIGMSTYYLEEDSVFQLPLRQPDGTLGEYVQIECWTHESTGVAYFPGDSITVHPNDYLRAQYILTGKDSTIIFSHYELGEEVPDDAIWGWSWNPLSLSADSSSYRLESKFNYDSDWIPYRNGKPATDFVTASGERVLHWSESKGTYNEVKDIENYYGQVLYAVYK